MVSTTQIERIAVNRVSDYIDTSDTLRANIPVNDKSPIWDGEILVYDVIPDRNSTLRGAIRVQVKGKAVDEFKDHEQFYIPVGDAENYMRNGGILFFLVELLPHNDWSHRIFHGFLSPMNIKTLLKNNVNKNIKIQLYPMPTSSKRFEQDVKDFMHNSLKQQSFTDKPTLSLQNAIDPSKSTTLLTSFVAKGDGDLAWQLTSQPLTLYKQTPYADIPIEDKEFYVTAKKVYNDAVYVDGIKYFDKYFSELGVGYVDIIIDDCLSLHTPRKGYEIGFKGSINLKYKYKLPIDECIYKMRFLSHAVQSNSITFGNYTYSLCLSETEQTKFMKQIRETLSAYEDMKTMWRLFNVCSPLNLTEFDDKGLDELCNIVSHVYRKRPGVLKIGAEDKDKDEDEAFQVFSAGRYAFLFHVKRQYDNMYITSDPFTTKGLQIIRTTENQFVPLLSLIIRQFPGYLFDNIYYEAQSHMYNLCYQKDSRVASIYHDDIKILDRLIAREEKLQKREKAQWLVNEIKKLLLSE